MDIRTNFDQITEQASDASSRALVLVSLCLGLSILYQIYFYSFDQGALTGGAEERLLMKLVFASLFTLGVKDYLSISAFSLNLILKLPLLFVAITIAIVAPFLDTYDAQALNLFFFFPILFIDWNKSGAEHLYKIIWKTICAIVTVQLILDPLFKYYLNAGWENAAVIGGMGNPNVFGVFLVASGLAIAVLLRPRFRYISLLFFLATPLTGSLVSAVVGIMCLVIQLTLMCFRAPIRTLLMSGLAVIVSLSTIVVGLIDESKSLNHAFSKLVAVVDLIAGSGAIESESISGRIDYLRGGLTLMGDAPLSIIIGHPGFVAMYNGDGLLTSFLVSYGLPVTACFLFANFIVLHRALTSRSTDLVFSGGVISVMLIFFVTNRILDYWPAALIYLLAFSYLATKGIRRRDAASSNRT